MDPFHYYAFISYNHRDAKIAQWLHKSLESYKLPVEMKNELDAGQRYLRPVFRDKDELNAGVLADELRKKLEQSKYLIVICSPNSAQSEWVNSEVETFISLGRIADIIPLMVDGSMDHIPSALKEYFSQHPDKELLGVSIPDSGKERALVKVVSRMLGIDFNILWDRHARQERKKTMIRTAVATALLALLFAVYNLRINVQVEKANVELASIEEEIKVGNLLPASHRLIDLLQNRFANKTAMEKLYRIAEYFKYEDSLVPCYSIMRTPVEAKMNAHSVCVSGDGRFVAWLEDGGGPSTLPEDPRIGVLNVSSGDTTVVYLPHRVHDAPPSDGSMMTDMGFELHACEFLPDGHVVVVLTSDGIVEYDCDEHSVRDVKADHGWRRTRTQHTDFPDYHPHLAIDPSGRYLATISEDYTSILVRIWDQNSLELLYSTSFENGEDLSFVKNDDVDALAIYDGGWSTRGIHYVAVPSFATLPDRSVPYSRDYFLTATNRIVHEDPEHRWFSGDDYLMMVKPFPVAGTDVVFGKQRGYDDVVSTVGGSDDIEDFLNPAMEWLYGYDLEHHAYMVLLRDETVLHSDSAIDVLVADNGDMINVFFRSPGYAIDKNERDLKLFFQGLDLGR